MHWAPAILPGQRVGHQPEGALRVGHGLLDGQELHLRGVDGSMLAHDVPVIAGLRPLRGLRGEAVITEGLTDPRDLAGRGRDSVGPAGVQHTWQWSQGRGWGAGLRNGGDPQVVAAGG